MIFFLVASVSANIYLLSKKINRDSRQSEKDKLHIFKKTPHEEGLAHFNRQLKKNYPETTLNNKYFVVYRWDSLLYDVMYRAQMMALDSMSAGFGKYTLEYVFVTEMEEQASVDFLKKNNDEFRHVKMLYEMDDYISGLYSIHDIKLVKPVVTRLKPANTNSGNKNDETLNFKQRILYLIMDPEGKILFTNQNKWMVIKDEGFLNTLNTLLPDKNRETLN